MKLTYTQKGDKLPSLTNDLHEGLGEVIVEHGHTRVTHKIKEEIYNQHAPFEQVLSILALLLEENEQCARITDHTCVSLPG